MADRRGLRFVRDHQSLSVGLAALVVLGIALCCFLLFRQPTASAATWHVSPAGGREGSARAWERLTHPPAPTAPTLLRASPSDVSVAVGSIHYEIDSFLCGFHNAPDEVVFLQSSGSEDAVTTGPPRLLALGSATPGPEDEGNQAAWWTGSRPFRFFLPNGDPLSVEAIDRLGACPHEAGPRVPEFPDIDAPSHPYLFLFAMPDARDARLLSYELVDQATKTEFANRLAYIPGSPDPVPYLPVEMRTWRSAPLFLMADMALGPVVPHDLPATEGAEADLTKARVRLLKIIGGSPRSTRYSRGSKTIKGDIGYEPSERETIMILACSPELRLLRPELAAIDREGRIFPAQAVWGDYFEGGVLNLFVGLPVQNVAFVRVSFRPRVVRYILPIDRLPGLPPENDQVTNLLDVRIPYLRLENDSQLVDACGWALLLRFSRSGQHWQSAPDGYFPHEYTNTTPRKLLKEFLKYQSSGTNIVFNEEYERIEIVAQPSTWDLVRFRILSIPHR